MPDLTPNTPAPPAHTAGLLTLDEWGNVVAPSGRPLELVGVALAMGNRVDRREADENRRRLVAAWNACSALTTEALESGAVERLVDTAYLVAGAWMDDSLTKDDVQNLLAALALATGQERRSDG